VSIEAYINQNITRKHQKNASAGLVSLGISVPGMLIGLLVISLKVHETKNADLEAVTGHEGQH